MEIETENQMGMNWTLVGLWDGESEALGLREGSH